MDLIQNIKHNGKIALLFFLVLFLEIVCSNTYNKSIDDIGNSFSEVYFDRLLAQDYIYKLSDKLHNKQQHLAQKTKPEEIKIFFQGQEVSFYLLLSKYEETKFTKEETKIFDALKENIFALIKAEELFVRSDNTLFQNSLIKSHEKHLKHALLQLNKLSEIQILQGKRLNDESKKIVSFAHVLNQFDWALIIIIGSIIQALIFAVKSTFPKTTKSEFLN